MLWAKTTQEKFNEYGIPITNQRQLSNGEYLLHMELADFPEFLLAARFDTDVSFLDQEQVDEILSLEETVQEIQEIQTEPE
jgi:hypothetical protein